jgi:hypothetical protein
MLPEYYPDVLRLSYLQNQVMDFVVARRRELCDKEILFAK